MNARSFFIATLLSISLAVIVPFAWAEVLDDFPLDLKDRSRHHVRVFIVHGTFGGDAEWPWDLPGKTSFASELKKALGNRSTIHEFHWSSQNKHDSRDRAASNLAEMIDELSRRKDRVVILGHSHGGNVALLAASRVKHPIDTVVCLSTPHVYLVMENQQKQRVPLPVYCPPQSLARIREIITLTPSADKVPDFWAGIADGLNDDDALRMTMPWRMKQTLKLRNVSAWWRDVLFEKTGILDEIVNLDTRHDLLLTNHNYRYLSDVRGKAAPHDAVHSCRLGCILGHVIRCGMTDSVSQYLSTIRQREPSDFGLPVDPRVLQDRRDQWYTGITHPQLETDMRITSATLKVSPHSNFGDRKPDLYFRILDDQGRELLQAADAPGGHQARWTSADLGQLLPVLRSGQIDIWDDDLNGDDKIGDTLSFDLNFKPGQFQLRQEYKTREFTLTLTWQRLHE